MEFFIEKQLLIVLNSVILGLIFGAIYDIIRISHIMCAIASYSGENRGMRSCKAAFLIFAAGDLVYVIVVSVMLSFFVYWQNNGVIRSFIVFPCIAGFAVYHVTIGKLVMYFSEAVVRFIRLVFRYTVAIPVMFLLKIVRKTVRLIYSVTIGKLVFALGEKYDSHRTDLFLKSLEKEIRFDYTPEKNKNRGKEKKRK